MSFSHRVASRASAVAVSGGLFSLARLALLVRLAFVFFLAPVQAQQIQYPVATVSVGDANQAASFKQVDALIASGAFGLAERHLLTQRPPLSQSGLWMRWERRLWALYRQRGRWQALVDRTDRLPAGLPQDFQLSAGVNKVAGHLRLAQPVLARETATRLLWQSENIAAGTANSLRRLIVRSYLAQDLNDEARVAALRFQRELNPVDENWITVYARTLLKTNRPDLVTRELSSSTLPSIRQLLALSRLRDGSLTPNQVIDLALTRVRASNGGSGNERNASEDDASRASWWSVVAEAASRGRNLPMRVQALEEALNLSTNSQSVLNTLVNNSVLDLLEAYKEMAQSSAQNAGLSDDYTDWMAHADKITKDFPTASRAIYSYVARSTLRAEQAVLANGRLANSLYQSGKQRLMFSLYGEQGAIAKFSELPNAFVYALADEAIEKRFLRRAAALTKHLNTPPPNIDAGDWQLRQARLALYSQDVDRATQILQNWIENKPLVSAEQADRVLQIIFDLQTVDKHDAALALLNQVQGRLAETKQRREVLYWQADSQRAQKRYEQAAENYLASAFSFGDANDLWGQSARVKAAEAMTEAGLADDARNVYETLLRITQDKGRRAELTQRLQKLLLKQSVENSNESEDG